ncbi:MAG: hypothetical protein ACM3X5_10175 [Bacillota bacterium]
MDHLNGLKRRPDAGNEGLLLGFLRGAIQEDDDFDALDDVSGHEAVAGLDLEVPKLEPKLRLADAGPRTIGPANEVLDEVAHDHSPLPAAYGEIYVSVYETIGRMRSALNAESGALSDPEQKRLIALRLVAIEAEATKLLNEYRCFVAHRDA